MGIQPRHFLAHLRCHHFVPRRALLSGYKMLFRRTAERAAVGMKADHVEATDQADVLLAFHIGPHEITGEGSISFQTSRI